MGLLDQIVDRVIEGKLGGVSQDPEERDGGFHRKIE